MSTSYPAESDPEPPPPERDLSISPLIPLLQAQPADSRAAVVLHGYIGDVADGVVTVYPALDLSWYWLIPEASILWAEKAVPGLQSSPTRLVVDARARIETLFATTFQSEAWFLTGGISEANLAAAKSESAGMDKFLSGMYCPGDQVQLCASPPGAQTGCWRSGACVSRPPAPRPVP